MTYASVCSGIEAATQAWHVLGWKPAFFAEIEPFPAAVLAHRWPGVPNYGDLTRFHEWPLEKHEPIDLLVAGTPCQSFSVAGLRAGLDDPRGNLALVFLGLVERMRPRWVVWENVPGVHSSWSDAAVRAASQESLKAVAEARQACVAAGLDLGTDFRPRQFEEADQSNDFDCFLSGLEQLGYGLATRVLDAQHFGVPQRRRRVFVVGHLGGCWQRAAAVLFERECLSGNPPPGRKAGQGTAGTLAARTGGGGRPDGGDGRHDQLVSHALTPSLSLHPMRGEGARRAGEGDADRAGEEVNLISDGEESVGYQPVLRYPSPISRKHTTQPRLPAGDECYNLVSQPVAFHGSQDPDVSGDVTHPVGRNQGQETCVALLDEPPEVVGPLMTHATPNGHGCAGVNNQSAYSGHVIPVTAFQPRIARNGRGDMGDQVNALNAESGRTGKGDAAPCVAISDFSPTPATGSSCHASPQEAHARAMLRAVRDQIGAEAFTQWGLGMLDSLQPSEVLRAAVHGQGIRFPAFSRNWLVHCASSCAKGRATGAVQSVWEAQGEGCASPRWQPAEQLARELGAYLSELPQPGAQGQRFVSDLWAAGEGLGLLRQALSAVQEVGRSPGGEGQSAHPGSQVRRLTCEECEFLQGFPRGYTRIPWRGRPESDCPDGPRYRALGNSKAVPVVRWIGRRIQLLEETLGPLSP